MVAANFFVPIFSPILVGVLGIWLILGRMDAVRRILLAAMLTFLLSLGGGSPLFFLFAVLVFVAAGTFVMSLIIFAKVADHVRTPQFSLWETGIIITGLGILFGIFRGIHESQAFEQVPTGKLVELLVQAATVSINIVLGSLMVFIPDRYRSARWFYLSAASVIVLMPLVEILVLALYGWSWEMFVLLGMMHIGGALALWLVIYPLEFAGMFREKSL